MKTGLLCQPLDDPPGLPLVSVNRYSTGPSTLKPVVAVMLMTLELPATGGTAKPAGSGMTGAHAASTCGLAGRPLICASGV